MLQGTNAPTARVRARAFLEALELDPDGEGMGYGPNGELRISLAPSRTGALVSLYADDLRAILDEIPGEPGTQETESS
jgi:hypothetical protein